MKKTIILLATALIGGTSTAMADSLDLASVLTTSPTVTYTVENDPVYPWSVTDSSMSVTHSDYNNISWVTLNLSSPGATAISADYSVNFTNSYYYSNVYFYIDGKEVFYTQKYNNFSESVKLFCQEGEHTLSIGFKPQTSSEATFTLSNFRIDDMQHEALDITLADTGMLGNEVLSLVSTLPDVKYMKISGQMNNTDWNVINNMTSLLYCDMSESDVTDIPESAFANTSLRIIKFPTALKSIGNKSFYYRPLVGEIVLPETLEQIGDYAFYYSEISSLVIPPSVNWIGEYAFSNCEPLETIDYGGSMTWIPKSCFSRCSNLKSVTGLQSVKKVESSGFYECQNLQSLGAFAPEEIYSYAFNYAHKLSEIDLTKARIIESNAFRECNALESVKLSDKVSVIGNYAFAYCTGLKDLYLGASVRQLSSYAFSGSNNLKQIHLKSPAPPTVDNAFSSSIPTQATLYVPEYAVVSYKLDDYWSKFTTVDINPETATEINLYGTLELTSNARIPGAPDVWIGWQDLYQKGGSLTVNGDNPQEFGDFTQMITTFTYSDYESPSGTLLSRCANMSSKSSTVKHRCNSNYWYYICMPFDVRRADIVCENGASLSVCRYDGQIRAEMGGTNGSSWVQLADDDILYAGHGYIFAVSKEDFVCLPATEETHNMIFTNDAVTTELTEYPATYSADAGWNLVGNPYPCFYDISYMDYTAPITVWDTSNRTYSAYSVADDDLVLYPLKAFFVQKPAGIDDITLQPRGRQTSRKLNRPSQMIASSTEASARKVINLQLSDGNTADMTRLVVNPDALADFDPASDASKMLSCISTAQIYSIGDGTYYAINEGVSTDCSLQLGVWMPADGLYTIDATRADANVQLYDNGRLVMMPYTFSAPAGSDNSRFTVKIAADASGIDAIENTYGTDAPIYDIMGRRVANPTKGIYIQNNKKIYK